mgnify:CR=1 FL=1
MMSVAIAAIWLGGYTFMGLVIAIGLGVFFEFTKLVLGFAQSRQAQILWLLVGLTYVGLACFTLLLFSAPFFGMTPAIMLIAGVIGTDVGAYFAGRSLGGPKIAPRISPARRLTASITSGRSDETRITATPFAARSWIRA